MQPSHGALRPGGLFYEKFGPKVPSQCRDGWSDASFGWWRTLASDNFIFIFVFPDNGMSNGRSSVEFGRSVLLAPWTGTCHRMIECPPCRIFG